MFDGGRSLDDVPALSCRLAPLLAVGAVLALAATGRAQAPPPSGFPGVAPEAPPARILSFGTDQDDVAAGDPVTLRWEAINAYAIELDPGQGAVATRGTRIVYPAATTTYTLSVTGPRGVTTESVTVAVIGGDRDAAAAAGSQRQSVPRLGDGRPDLTGVYLGGRDIRVVGDVVLAPGAESFRVEPDATDLGQGALCLPPGVPAATMMPYPLQIVHREDMLVILYEAYNLFRIIPLGAAHPEDLDPTWMGHSVASWDGDTLVVDVVAFNDRTRVAGYRHTEAMHVVERYRRSSYDTIEYEAIVEDPNVFAEPIRYAGNLALHPEWEIGEYVCAENNKDYAELFSD
ncbi:MAG TPA: hypothetical protein VMR74_02955 [Gammaproteobacteria bacterium]|nr:hypothetical protein [Gammaproteobacteria bacterium]